MKAAGYEVIWNDQYKNIKYTCTKEKKHKNGKYPECNDDKLSDEKYLKENMEYEFELRKNDDGRAGRAQSSGKGGDTILSVCKEVLAEVFPEYAHFNITMPSEYMRRVGQSIAAASLAKSL
jgi:hypothetical protein